MGEKTGIEWTQPPGYIGSTWNPWYGCRKVSPACAHCYAEREMARWGRDFNKVKRASDATFRAPLIRWLSPHCIFTCSWSDFFIEQADNWRAEAWRIIEQTPQHVYQILTKRPERIVGEMYANIWLGASVENARFYQRIDQLTSVKAAVHFLSIEPLLGPMPDLPLDDIEWVIVGGESGAGFRPLNLDLVRAIRDRCIAHGVAFFFKQKSALHPKQLDRLLDGREWNEYPLHRVYRPTWMSRPLDDYDMEGCS